MPGVNVLPASPSFGTFGPSSHSTSQNGLVRSQDSMNVAEIKERAKDNVQKEARGATALTLIKTARTQSLSAYALEEKGDLKGALDALTKAARLAQMFMDSAEFLAEKQPGKHGLLFREFKDFMSHSGSDLAGRTDALESRLKDAEKATHFVDSTKTDNSPITKPGGSIADRMASLQSAGLSLSSTKRFLNSNVSTPPMSPDMSRHNRNKSLGLSPPLDNLTNTGPVTPISSTPSPHALVSPSSLGPPSPTSSPSSSPQISHFTLSEFSQTFPSIDELDELDVLKHPSSVIHTDGPPPSVEVRSFPVLSVDPGVRPSSTPITPVTNTFMSQPGSPALTHTVLPKPPGLGISKAPVVPAPPSPDKPELPVSNLVLPKALHGYINQGLNVLFLDIRNRADFDKEHIKADAVLCLEPSVLMRENVNGQTLEDSLTVGPRQEWSLFSNRDKFDLIAIYDDSSESFGAMDTPLSVLVHAIYEIAFQKMLKKMPVLIVGGLNAWKKDLGQDEIVRGGLSLTLPDLPKVLPLQNAATGPSSNVFSQPFPDPHKLWTPQMKADHSVPPIDKDRLLQNGDRGRPPLDLPLGSSQSMADSSFVNGHQPPESAKYPPRRPPLPRPPTTLASPSYTRPRGISDNISNASIPQSPISYPQVPRHLPSASASVSSFTSTSGSFGLVSPPPQASINPSLSRRRSDYIDQSQEALSGMSPARPSIDYPELSSQQILRPPPAAASSALERQDNRPRLVHQSNSYSPSNVTLAGPKPPRIPSDYPVTYWSDVQIGTSGLKNMGNTCYMNAPIQCLSATVPFARFFTDGRWKNAVNFMNPLGTKGNVARSFARLLHDMWHGELPYITPVEFRSSIYAHAERFRGSDQHDSQEFLSFLLDGIHEDLNRILNKPPGVSTPEREAELERLPQQIASEQEWHIWRMRNDSLIVDFFQGQFRNRLECMTCHKTSTTYDPFTSLPLPVPSGRTSKVNLRQCLDNFVKTEVMEKNDAWRCPHCKELRKTTKQLSLSRLPPVLIIHLKRFSFEGRWTDKIDTFVDFPMKALDLTNYMPPPLPPGIDKGPIHAAHAISPDDPRSQLPPYRYDLYAVTNHFGSLSSGHYTAFVSSRGGWLYCDDSSVKPADGREVVNKQAYMLFYKRTKV